jgi:hypothetical protein
VAVLVEQGDVLVHECLQVGDCVPAGGAGGLGPFSVLAEVPQVAVRDRT